MNKQQLQQAAAQIAAEYGIPVPDFFRLIEIESGWNPNAKNANSSASGLGQFTTGTAKQYGLTNPFDPIQNLIATARYWVSNRDFLRQRLGVEPEGWMMYAAHQQGPGGALKMLGNPNASATEALGHAQVVNNGGDSRMTLGQFTNIWRNRFNQAGSGGEAPDGYGLSTGENVDYAGYVQPGNAGYAQPDSSGYANAYGMGNSDPMLQLMRIASGEVNPYRSAPVNPLPNAYNGFARAYGAFQGDPYLTGSAF